MSSTNPNLDDNSSRPSHPTSSPSSQPENAASAPSDSPKRPARIDLFTEEEIVDHGLPSPPYRANPSRPDVNVYLNPFTDDSPAYRSNADFFDESSAIMSDQKQGWHEHQDQDQDQDSNEELHRGRQETRKPAMKVARFTSDVASPPPSAAPLPPFARTETGLESVRSRSPSIAGTDDEDDDYDWSGEEDLVDEEAKFEQNMGVAKKERWGFRK